MSELTHFGVPGMKWGHRKAVATATGSGSPSASKKLVRSNAKNQKQLARYANGVNRGNAMIAKYGSVNKAYLAIGVRRVGVAMVSVGADGIAKNMILNGKNKGVAVGISAVGNTANMGMFIKDIIDARDIHRASVARGN